MPLPISPWAMSHSLFCCGSPIWYPGPHGVAHSTPFIPAVGLASADAPEHLRELTISCSVRILRTCIGDRDRDLAVAIGDGDGNGDGNGNGDGDGNGNGDGNGW